VDECHKVQHTDMRVQFDYFLVTFKLCRFNNCRSRNSDDVAIKPVANITRCGITQDVVTTLMTGYFVFFLGGGGL
jgi:hypothetical protein